MRGRTTVATPLRRSFGTLYYRLSLFYYYNTRFKSHGCLRLETRFIIGIFGNRNKNNDEDLIMSDVCSNVVGTLLCVVNGHMIY